MHRFSIKLFIENPAAVDREKIVLAFHHWIQQQSLSGHLLIDVASYDHVPDGPTVVLVSHEANITLDRTDGRLGLIYQRKRPLPGELSDRLAAVLTSTLEACSKLETDPDLAGSVKFKTDELVLKILDKLHAPNEPATLDEIRPALSEVFEKVFDGPVNIEQKLDSVRPFELHVRAEHSSSLSDLLDRSAIASS